jgi:hypothetical protein
MKKYLLIFALFVSMSVYGQFNTGSVYFTGMTGANLGFELQQTYATIPYNLNVEGGYFLRNRLSLGGTVHSHGNIGLGEFGSSNHELFLGAMIRYYLPRDEGLQVYLYGNPFFSVATSDNRFGVSGGAGINYFITERIALEARGYYRFMRYTNEFDGGFNNHSLNFDIGISIFFPSISFFSN